MSTARERRAKPDRTASNSEVDQDDCAERLTPRFEIELPKGVECCCLFDGSIVKTVYLSPRRGPHARLSRTHI
jgi:hypothetical protein